MDALLGLLIITYCATLLWSLLRPIELMPLWAVRVGWFAAGGVVAWELDRGRWLGVAVSVIVCWRWQYEIDRRNDRELSDSEAA